MKYATRCKRGSAFAVLTFAWLLLGIEGAQPGFAEEEHGSEVVNLSPSEMEEFGVQIAVAGPGKLSLVRTLPGEVQVDRNHLAHIVPRYSGIVTEVLADIGDKVKKGDILAIVESDGSLAPYDIETLIDGTVIEKHMTLGEPVSRDDAGFVVADLSTVWIDITVYQRDIDLVELGNAVTVTAGSRVPAVRSVIDYITPVIDERTRTATARLVVANKNGRWRPGMFVTADVEVGSISADIMIPTSAVHTFEGRDVVFVATDHGFEPVAVTIGSRSRNDVEITSGLSEGQRFVSVGGFIMKSELSKESFGEGHGH